MDPAPLPLETKPYLVKSVKSSAAGVAEYIAHLEAENAKLKQWCEDSNNSNRCLKAMMREMLDYI